MLRRVLLLLLVACGSSSPPKPKLHGCRQYVEMQVRCDASDDNQTMRELLNDQCQDADRLADKRTLNNLACAESTDDCDTYGSCVYNWLEAHSAP